MGIGKAPTVVRSSCKRRPADFLGRKSVHATGFSRRRKLGTNDGGTSAGTGVVLVETDAPPPQFAKLPVIYGSLSRGFVSPAADEPFKLSAVGRPCTGDLIGRDPPMRRWLRCLLLTLWRRAERQRLGPGAFVLESFPGSSPNRMNHLSGSSDPANSWSS